MTNYTNDDDDGYMTGDEYPEPPPRKPVGVYLGTYKLHGLIAEHWAVAVGDRWYEVVGTSPLQRQEPNEIQVHTDDSKYTTITLVATIDMSRVTEKYLHDTAEAWSKGWLRQHPYYDIFSDNCQLFVKDFFLENLGGMEIVPQMQQIVSAVRRAGSMIRDVASMTGTIAQGLATGLYQSTSSTIGDLFDFSTSFFNK